ncbi:(2Fe-2S)-binding protein [Pyrobaculum neutrophilum]|uniref:(2Fe-2S)-binding domain protein n=1 Tax=Pyrobaculum neutrophilum (strain DSM 2338 / JCM 9278 / NBRC 100436 / V24Sta) TaxID=444157 RepID=B1YD73_PYRNV|nr:(2Fe-2S)-binding protein [Pyrobaculum neutrophilum]ACB39736.1 (2Fe-2S)-binding domain protein [Pyrobaculum neutrophilum V24Sta]
MRVRLRVNGVWHEVDVEPRALLVHVLRDLGYRSVRVGCDTATCGACTVLMNGRPVKSCNVLAVQADGAEIYTAEYSDEVMERLREAFKRKHAAQCGFCTSGMLLTAYYLVKRGAKTAEEIAEGLAGVLCRCTGYQNIVEAVKEVANS